MEKCLGQLASVRTGFPMAFQLVAGTIIRVTRSNKEGTMALRYLLGIYLFKAKSAQGFRKFNQNEAAHAEQV